MASSSAQSAVALRAWPLKGAPEVAAALGRAPALRLLRHQHVAPLLDCVRGRHFTIVTVAEYTTPLRTRLVRLAQAPDEAWIGKVLFEVLQGLSYLHRRNFAHRMFSMDTVEVDSDGNTRLSDAWVSELCNSGANAAFVLGQPGYAAPEALLMQPGYTPSPTAAAAADIWAVGALLTELLQLNSSPSSPLASSPSSSASSLATSHVATLRKLATASADNFPIRPGVSDQLRDFLRLCLSSLASHRPSADELLLHPFFVSLSFNPPPPRWQQRPALKCLNLLSNGTASVSLHASPSTSSLSSSNSSISLTSASSRRMGAAGDQSEVSEAYGLWRTAGAEPEREMTAAQPPSPPLLRLPSVLLLANTPAHTPPLLRDDPRPFILTLAALRRRPSASLNANSNTPAPPLARSQSGTLPAANPGALASSGSSIMSSSTHSTPQFGNATAPPVSPRSIGSATAARIKQLRELLSALPASLPRLALELRSDVPSAVRAEVWSALLGVNATDAATAYASVDKDAEGLADRQIEVDIPRCHQYNELLASPEGQRKLKRVLKAWVRRHVGQLVYWQGLDSLLAPLLTVFFPNEALAYSALVKVVSKFCREFFRPDNSSPMQEHLLRFRHLLAFHDPVLATHLTMIGFTPDLYAIPWFLTLFSHLLPLDKLYTLWDSILAGSQSLPFFIALAILREMRSTLLPLDFNASILFFSHLPELDVREVLRQAVQYEERTPVSIVVPFSPPPALPGVTFPLEERQQEWAPRVAPNEALRVRHAQLIDVRKRKDFEYEHVIGSVPINHKNPSISQFEAYRGKPLILIADVRGRQAANLAKQLIEAGYAEVALVHGGYDALRTVGGVKTEGTSNNSS